MFEFKDGPTAQWRPDPFGRYELRRFFLGAPTSLVKSGEILGYDQIDVEVPAEAPLHTAPQVPPVPPVQVPSAPAMEEPHVPLAPAAAFAAGPTTVARWKDKARVVVARSPIQGRALLYAAVVAVLIVTIVPLALVLGGTPKTSHLGAPISPNSSTTTTAGPAVALPVTSTTKGQSVTSTTASTTTTTLSANPIVALGQLALQAQKTQPSTATKAAAPSSSGGSSHPTSTSSSPAAG